MPKLSIDTTQNYSPNFNAKKRQPKNSNPDCTNILFPLGKLWFWYVMKNKIKKV